MFSVEFIINIGEIGIEGLVALSERRRLGLPDGSEIWFNGSTVIDGIPMDAVADLPEFETSARPTFVISNLGVLTASDVEERRTNDWSYGQPSQALHLVIRRELPATRAIELIRMTKKAEAEAAERCRREEEEVRRKEVRNLRAEVEAKQEEAEKLRQQLKAEESAILSLQDELEAVYREVTELQTAKNEAKAELARVKKAVAEAAEEIDRTRRSFKSRVLAGIRITLERISQQ